MDIKMIPGKMIITFGLWITYTYVILSSFSSFISGGNVSEWVAILMFFLCIMLGIYGIGGIIIKIYEAIKILME